MAKHLYQIGFKNIQKYIFENKTIINSHILDNTKLELSRNFGKSYYEIDILNFLETFKIIDEPRYALQILNIFKSSSFVGQLYDYLGLKIFENKNIVDRHNIFYSFVYFLHTDISSQKEKIIDKLFLHYFLHFLSSIKQQSNINLNYKDMTLSCVKNKNLILKEIFSVDDDTNMMIFKILLNDKIAIQLKGKSIKTLRKKAYKDIFHLLITKTTK